MNNSEALAKLNKLPTTPSQIITKTWGMERGFVKYTYEITFSFSRGKSFAAYAKFIERVRREVEAAGYRVDKMRSGHCWHIGKGEAGSYWSGSVTFEIRTPEQDAADEQEIEERARDFASYIRRRRTDAQAEVLEGKEGTNEE